MDAEQGQGLAQGCPPAGLGWVCGLLAVAEREPGRRDIGVITAVREETKPTLSRVQSALAEGSGLLTHFTDDPQVQGLAGLWNGLG